MRPLNINLSHGFLYQIRADGIVVYRLTNLDRETVDAFVAFTHEIDMKALETDSHSRCLLDVTALSMPTPYAAKRIQDSISRTPDALRESYAIITPTNLVYSFVRSVLNRLPQSETNSIRLFRDEARAVTWLNERLALIGP